MASRASSASAGEVFEHQHKANNISQPGERTINDSNRVFGRDGASVDYGQSLTDLSRLSLTSTGYAHRALSRSPSPYRRKRTRSPSPSPYRHRPTQSRSPSPFHHGRLNRGNDVNDSRPPHKRKASPPRGGRSDKRHHTDRSRHNDRRPKARYDDSRPGPLQPAPYRDQVPPRPISYADNENPAPVPHFRDDLPQVHPSLQNGGKYPPRKNHVTWTRESMARGSNVSSSKSETEDVEMYIPP